MQTDHKKKTGQMSTTNGDSGVGKDVLSLDNFRTALPVNEQAIVWLVKLSDQ